MRAVLDTNVVVSALIWGGTPFRLFEAASIGDLQLFTSPALLAELHGVLTRGHLALQLERRRSSVEKIFTLYSELAASVVPINIPRIVPDDPDDDQVIAAAITASVDMIVSGDRHLLALGAYSGIRIVGPADALATLYPYP